MEKYIEKELKTLFSEFAMEDIRVRSVITDPRKVVDGEGGGGASTGRGLNYELGR